jgi:hypothetical protein
MNSKIVSLFIVLNLLFWSQIEAKDNKKIQKLIYPQNDIKILVDTAIQEMIKSDQKKIKKWDISASEISEAKEIIIKINILILNNDLNEFMNIFGEGALLASFLDEPALDLKQDIIKDKKLFDWIKQIFFGKELLQKEKLIKADMNYFDSLIAAIKNKNYKKIKYVIGIGEYTNDARFYFKDQDVYYDIYSVFSFDKGWDNSVGFGIRKINNQWKIISYH